MHHVQYKGDASTCHRLELANVHAQHLLGARVDSLSANACTSDAVPFFSRHAVVAPHPFLVAYLYRCMHANRCL